MPSSFIPLSAAPPGEVARYFADAGSPPEIVAWKYFDRKFNRGRERGYVWLHNGAMVGFIGLIPFAAANGPECVRAAWTVDWGLQKPNLGGGVGVMLMWQALRSYPVLFGLGGNARSRAVFPKMAAKTVPAAAIALYLPLRLGAAVKALPSVPRLSAAVLDRLGRLPVRHLPASAGEDAVSIQPGVDPAVGPILEGTAAAGWHPRYDFEYLDWQVGRCPDLECCTCYLPSSGGPGAAALLWHHRKSSAYWRMALLASGQDSHGEHLLLSRAVRHAYDCGAHLLAALVSHLDVPAIRTLKAAGFVAAPNRRTLFAVTGRDETLPVDDLRQLSYLDSDLAHFL